jgi:hypothetical protein
MAAKLKIEKMEMKFKEKSSIWKGAIPGSFHQSFVAIGPVVSEEKFFIRISHKVLC